MSAVSSPAEVAAQPAAREQLSLRPADLLLLVAVALWAVGVSRTDASHLGPYGLVTAVPLIFYAGLAVLVVSAALELGRAAPSRARMAVHAVLLVVMLYGTAPLVYPEGRYSWLYKTIGVVQYVNAHGRLNPNIDIYQNWPGYFAFAAWFDKVAGVASPLAYAKWAQLVAELAALPLLHMAYTALSLPMRQRWAAILLYSASNWIAQDYLSPQALGTLFSLGVVAIALRWMFGGNAAGRSRRLIRPGEQSPPGRHRYWARWRVRRALPFILTLILVFAVLTFTHELSPYVVLVQIGCLAVTGLVRPRWVPLVLAAVAIGYLLPRLGFVNSHFGLLGSIGDFFSNVAPPSSRATVPVPHSQAVIQMCARALAAGIWLAALVGAWLRRRSRRTVLALLVLAYSPVAVLAAGAYGDEGILRVYLFSLPWAAALVAAAIAPLPVLARRGQAAGSPAAPGPALRRWLASRDPDTDGSPAIAARTLVALAAALALFFPAFFGDDAAVTISPAEVNTLASFLQTAPAGTIYAASDGAPLNDTARYNLFTIEDILGPTGLTKNTTAPADIAAVLARDAVQAQGNTRPAYVIVTPAMERYNASHPVATAGAYQIILTSLSRSTEWMPLLNSNGIHIYELPAGSQAP